MVRHWLICAGTALSVVAASSCSSNSGPLEPAGNGGVTSNGGAPNASGNGGSTSSAALGGAAAIAGDAGGGAVGPSEAGASSAGASSTNDGSEAPLVPVSFVESDADIENPERGFHTNEQTQVDSTCAFTADLSQARENGNTLLRVYVRLDAFRSSPLSDQCLSGIAGMFKNVRDEGLKLILRFSYNFCQGAGCDDASKATILNHVSQLTPVLQANADVLATLQAGFVGAWGEWHDSTARNLLARG